MAKRFSCSACGAEMVVRHLQTGEPAKCFACGAETPVPADAEYTDALPRTHPAGGPPATPVAGSLQPAEMSGVGGWLLFLCLSFAVFTPVLTLVSLVSSYASEARYFSSYAGLAAVTYLDTVLSLGLTAFSIYAGIGLWRVRPGAVRAAKAYLLTVLGYSLLAASLPFASSHRAVAGAQLATEAIAGVIRSAIYVAVWYSYLSRSKRVAATYCAAPAHADGRVEMI